MRQNIQVKIKKLHPNAVIPTYAYDGDACFDFTAVSVEYKKDIDTYVFHTGLAVELPEGYELQIRPRSGNRKKDCYLANSPGTVDHGYDGEILICYKNRDSLRVNILLDYMEKWIEDEGKLLVNKSIGNDVRHRSFLEYIQEKYKDVDFGAKYAPYDVGDKVAQGLVCAVPKVLFVEVDEIEGGKRGANGFGSTDVQKAELIWKRENKK